MIKKTALCARSKQFTNALRSAVTYFRSGEDEAGIDALFRSLDELEYLTDLCKDADMPQLEKMLPEMRKLLACIENQDAGGLVDLLEFSILPISNEWGRGCEEK